MRVAAFDCGTNSLRLLIAEVGPTGELIELDRQMRVVRLGEGVDRTGELAPQALARTFAATAEYAQLCTAAGVSRIRFVATSASRDATNRAVFTEGIRDVLGVEPEVVAGEVEAGLAFAGATHELLAEAQARIASRVLAEHNETPRSDELPGPFLVVDIGGGSTELIRGTASVAAAVSLDIGCVRLTERILQADPPTSEQIAQATEVIDQALDQVAAQVNLAGIGQLVGLAGSVLTVAAQVLDLPKYDPVRIHRAQLAVPQVLAACDQLLRMPRAQRAELPWMHPGRVDVIGAGALIWRQVVARVAAASGLATVTVSERDILDGIAASLIPAAPDA